MGTPKSDDKKFIFASYSHVIGFGERWGGASLLKVEMLRSAQHEQSSEFLKTRSSVHFFDGLAISSFTV
jgi:hypothetical protein